MEQQKKSCTTPECDCNRISYQIDPEIKDSLIYEENYFMTFYACGKIRFEITYSFIYHNTRSMRIDTNIAFGLIGDMCKQLDLYRSRYKVLNNPKFNRFMELVKNKINSEDLDNNLYKIAILHFIPRAKL